MRNSLPIDFVSFTLTDASYLPEYSIVKVECGVSSARVGSPFLFFDRDAGDSHKLELILFMESYS